ADRKRDRAEVLVEQADDGGDAARLHRVHQLAFDLFVIAGRGTYAAGELRFAEVEDGEIEARFFARDQRFDGDRAGAHARAPGAVGLVIVLRDAVAVDLRDGREVVEERGDGVVRGDAGEVEAGRHHLIDVDVAG